jgi:hypothetical protein
MSLSSPNSLSVRNKRLSLSPSPSLSCTFFRPSPSPNLVHRTSNKRLSLAQLSGSNKPLSRARAFNEQQHRSLYFIHSLFWSSLNLVINVSLSRSWRMSARVALSSRLSPSLLVAFLLDSLSFSAFAYLSNKRLSLSYCTAWSTDKHHRRTRMQEGFKVSGFRF